jgi:hypothetical protein
VRFYLGSPRAGLSALMLLCPLVTSCTDSSAEGAAATKGREAELRALAHDWQLNTSLSEAEGKTVRDKICALPEQETRLLHRILREKMEHTPATDQLSQASLEYAITHHKCIVSLTADDLSKVISQLSGKPVDEVRRGL